MVIEHFAIGLATAAWLDRIDAGKTVGGGGQKGIGLLRAPLQQGVGGAGLFGVGGDFGFHRIHTGEQFLDRFEIQPFGGILCGPLQIGNRCHPVIQPVNQRTVAAVLHGLICQRIQQFGIRQLVRGRDFKPAGQQFQPVTGQGGQVVQLLGGGHLCLALQGVDFIGRDV